MEYALEEIAQPQLDVSAQRNQSLTKELEQAKELLKESKKTIQWCVDNLHLPHTSDHFNVPMGTISLIEQNLN